MSPFGTESESKRSPGLLRQPALIVFVVCLAVGLGMAAWRAKVRGKAASNAARTLAMAEAAETELQFNQAISAAETLGALASQAGGAVPNFQKVAQDLLATRPGLATLELQPAGVVSDIVPKGGNERAIGTNVFKNPALAPDASVAMQSRMLTLSGPVPLYRGELGIVARVPVFTRGRDGREVCWGFVAASMRFSDALKNAGMGGLPAKGYHYAFFTPAFARQRAVFVAGLGGPPPEDVVPQKLRVPGLRFNLAVWPVSGWLSTTRVVIEALGTLMLAALLGLLTHLLEANRHLEQSLIETDQRVIRETAERKKALEELGRMKDAGSAMQGELEQTRAALRQAESGLAESLGVLDGAVRNAQDTGTAAQIQVKEAESKAAELQARLEAKVRSAEETANARQADLAEARAALDRAQQSVREFEARLAGMAEAEKQTADAQARWQQDQATIAGLQRRLESSTRTAERAAEASTTRLEELETANRQLQERLAAAEPSEAQVAELTERLQKAETELVRLREASIGSTGSAAADPSDPPPPVQPAVTNDPAAAAEPPASSAPAVVEPEPAPKAAATEESPAAETGAPDAPQPAQENPPLPETDNEPGPAGAAAKAPPLEDVSADEPSQTPTPAAAPEAQAKAPKRRKNRRDDQMDLFSGPAPDAQAAPEPDTDLKPESKPKEDKPAPARRLPTPPPVNLPQLRKAVNEILPLLTDQDPGAKDCLKANRDAFRSAFSPEGYVEFEQFVKSADFAAALEHLRKAVRKQGISI
jgi:sensor domain CHASE-containing protein